MSLDNAAKIFPSNSTKADPKVFRFACELLEEIDPEILQKAVDKALESFGGYLCVLKHGFFWYYLEDTDLRPVVREEYKPVCSPLYDSNVPTLLFEVTYYHCRINVEVFHVLADGTGAVEFLKEIVCQYLTLAHPDVKSDNKRSAKTYDASWGERMADSFQKYYKPGKRKRVRQRKAYKVRGARLAENRIKIVEGIMPVDKLIELSRSYKTTATVLLTAVLIASLFDSMHVTERKKRIVISVPVNLRNYFESETARNFFAVMNIAYQGSGEVPKLEELIEHVAAELKRNLTEEKLQEQINSFISVERNVAVRAVPLAVKDFALRLAYILSDRGVTAALSNIGIISLPDEYAPHIRLFDVMSSTEKTQVCICSFKNNFVVNFSDHFVSSDVQKKFFRTLSGMGIPVEIVSSPIDDDSYIPEKDETEGSDGR